MRLANTVNTTKTIPIIHSADPSATVEARAASELSAFLHLAYPDIGFPATTATPETGDRILLGTRASLPALAEFTSPEDAAAPGAFVVKHAARGGHTTGVICGQDAKGAMDGVFRFLEAKLGVCFYFNEAVRENAAGGAFDWALWNHAERPLFPVRGMNPWHSFYGSPTTMDFEEWKDYLARIARTGINWLCIHTYEHYAVRRFEFNGIKNFSQDPTSTRHGGEWSSRNIWDMRLLPHGGHLFAHPVHGSDSCREATMEERIAREKRLYRQFIEYARDQFGILTYEMLDMDNFGPGAVDQNQIMTLPESDRFHVANDDGNWPPGERWYPNTDTPGGFAFIKAQVRQVVEDRPGLAGLAAFWRGQINRNSLNVRPRELPPAWLEEMRRVYEDHPLMAAWGQRCYQFVMCKIARAFGRALDELGRADIRRGFGWWSTSDTDGTDAVRHADLFLPPSFDFLSGNHIQQSGIGYDYENYRKAAGDSGRWFLPVTYLQEDVSHIIGGTGVWQVDEFFSSKGAAMGVAGAFMSHFATRPTDLKQKHWANNFWSGTADEPRAASERRFVADMLGGGNAGPEAAEWAHAVSRCEGFGELCCNWFYDSFHGYPLCGWSKEENRRLVAQYDRLLALGERIPAAGLSPAARQRLDYYNKYFLFAKRMLETSYAVHFTDADRLPEDPFEVARLFVEALEAFPKHDHSRINAIDKGQAAEVYGRFVRQVLWRCKVEGRYPHYGAKFGPIGNWDMGFHVDANGIARPIHRCLGEGVRYVEAVAQAADAPCAEHLTDSYAEAPEGFTFSPCGELYQDNRVLPEGTYDLDIYLPAHLASKPGERTVSIRVQDRAPAEIDLYDGGRRSKVVSFQDVRSTGGELHVSFAPGRGPVAVSAVCATLKRELSSENPPPKPRSGWRFDFGPADVAPAGGWERVASSTSYRRDGLGYGWRHAVGMRDVARDSAAGIDATGVVSGIYRTFLADVPPGRYEITVRTGDPEGRQTRANIIVQGELAASNISTGCGQSFERTFSADAPDGRIAVSFSSTGQGFARWCASTIVVEPSPET